MGGVGMADKGTMETFGDIPDGVNRCDRDRFCRIHEDSMKRPVSLGIALSGRPEPKANQR
ncbi:hypothetical protein HNR46_004024 [Haloferula luteola]|uniref:Uncharacterized protein n=1 Tax=Haloferula luteola TaxID=595692 RepID=A0A840V708_9BACT|nr:hypothetical protein [Haloferula luteola]